MICNAALDMRLQAGSSQWTRYTDISHVSHYASGASCTLEACIAA